MKRIWKVIPFSCSRLRLLFRLLTHFTVQTAKMMATMKKSIPPTIPAVIALSLILRWMMYETFSLEAWLVNVCELILNIYVFPGLRFFTNYTIMLNVFVNVKRERPNFNGMINTLKIILWGLELWFTQPPPLIVVAIIHCKIRNGYISTTRIAPGEYNSIGSFGDGYILWRYWGWP